MPLDRYTILFSAILGIESLSHAIVLPLVPFIALRYGANELATGSIFALYSIFQLVSAPLLGALSDSWGRKPLLLLSQATTFAGFLILGLSNSLGLVFLSRVIDGASAGNVSLIYTATIDRYPREARTPVLGLLSTGAGLGLLVGPLLGGLLGAAGLSLPSFVAAALTVVTITMTALLFPGAITPSTRGPAPGPVNIRASFSMLRDPAIRRTLRVILINTALYNAFVLGMSLFLNKRLDYNATQIGPLLTGLLLLGALFQVLLLPRLLVSFRNRTSAWLGFCLYLVGFTGLLLAGEVVSVVAASTLVVWGIVILNPVLAGALANQAAGTDDGALMGLNQAVTSIGQIVGPLVGYAALYVASGVGFVITCMAMAVISMLLFRGITIYE